MFLFVRYYWLIILINILADNYTSFEFLCVFNYDNVHRSFSFHIIKSSLLCHSQKFLPNDHWPKRVHIMIQFRLYDTLWKQRNKTYGINYYYPFSKRRLVSTKMFLIVEWKEVETCGFRHSKEDAEDHNTSRIIHTYSCLPEIASVHTFRYWVH